MRDSALFICPESEASIVAARRAPQLRGRRAESGPSLSRSIHSGDKIPTLTETNNEIARFT